MKRTTLVLVLLAPAALAGCQTMKSLNPFHDSTPDYKAAEQERPLEVPPGMDQPPTSEALVIPNVSDAGTTAAGYNPAAPPAAPPAAVAPPAMGAVPVTTCGGSVSGSSGSSLTLADTPASAYHRVGLALARGEAGQLVARDDNAHTFQVAVNSVVKEEADGGFFYRLFHRDTTRTITGTVTVSVAPQGSGSLIQASGSPDAVERVMAMLKQRLGAG